MPIYEYSCPQCGHVFEEWTRTHDATEQQDCPRCGTAAPRIMSQTSFVLKGGGWYVTDYGYRKGISEDGSSEPAAKSSDKSETAQAAPAASQTAKTADAQTAPPPAAGSTAAAAPAAKNGG